MVLTLLKFLPRKWLSRLTGKVVHAANPAWFATWLKHKLIKSLKIDPSEAEKSVAEYPSFGKFFARKLKDGVRPLSEEEIISPCDGKVVCQGGIQNGKLIQCKGKEYTLMDLLQDEKAVEQFQDGYFTTIYLAPHNYHRVHVPMKSEILSSTFISGDLWPVNTNSVSKVENLFCINERWLTLFKTELGPMALLMVGATNVGFMELSHMSNDLNLDDLQETRFTSFDPPLKFEKGQEHGIFHMGSTVILLFSKQISAKLEQNPAPLGPIQFGQTLFDAKF